MKFRNSPVMGNQSFFLRPTSMRDVAKLGHFLPAFSGKKIEAWRGEAVLRPVEKGRIPKCFQPLLDVIRTAAQETNGLVNGQKDEGRERPPNVLVIFLVEDVAVS